jgi:hypothetical protein
MSADAPGGAPPTLDTLAPVTTTRAGRAVRDWHADPSPAVLLPGLCVLFVGLLALRAPGALSHPQFWAEDGARWYSDAYNHGFWRPLASPYAGYFQTFPRVFGGLATLLPLHLAPALMTWAATAVQLYTAIFMNRRRFYEALGTRWGALLLSVVYVVMPNSGDVLVNVTNTQWHLAVLGVMILVARPPSSSSDRLLDAAALAFFALTGPFVIFALPLALYVWHADGWERRPRVQGVILVVGAVIQVASLLASGSRGVQTDTLNLHVLSATYARQVVLGGLVGSRAVGTDLSYVEGLLVSGVALAFTTYVVWRAPPAIKALAVFGAVLFTSAVLSPPADLRHYWRLFLFVPGAAQRYWFVPMFTLLACAVWAVWRSPSRLVRALAAAALLATMFVAVPRDFRERRLVQLDYRAYERRLDRAPKGQTVILPINPIQLTWHLTLRKR